MTLSQCPLMTQSGHGVVLNGLRLKRYDVSLADMKCGSYQRKLV